MFRSVTAGVLCLFLACAAANASIIYWDCANDGDGAIDCTADWNQTDSQLTVTGNQFWGPGHMLGEFETDTPGDPTIKIRNSVDNDTGINWTGYHINFSMNHPYTLSLPVAYTPGDWTGSVTQTPAWNGEVYLGQVTFTGGTPIGADETFDFGYQVSFTGYTSYTFTQEMEPSPIPEPTALSLLAFAGLALLPRRARGQA